MEDDASGDLEQTLPRHHQPVDDRQRPGRIDPEPFVEPLGQPLHSDVVLRSDRVPAETHGPALERLGQRQLRCLSRFGEHEHPRSPAVVGGSRGVEPQHVRPPAQQTGGVRDAFQLIFEHVGVEGSVELA